MTGHARTEELIAAYVLDSLDGSDALEVTRQLLDHLASCEACSRLFRDLRETAADLALAAPVVPVPVALHDRVMAAVAPEQRDPLTVEDRCPIGPALRSGRLVRGLVAASVAAVLGLGGFSAALSRQLRATQGDQRLSEAALAFVNDPSIRVSNLTASPMAGRMTLAARGDGRAMLIGSDLRLPDDRVFEVWRKRGSEVLPLTTFVPRDGEALVELSLDPQHDAGLAVTVERRRVERPTTAPVFEGSLPA